MDLDLHRQGLQLNYEIRVLRLQRERRHGRDHFLRLQFDDHYAEALELVPLQQQSGFQRLLLLDRAGPARPDYEHFQVSDWNYGVDSQNHGGEARRQSVAVSGSDQ